MTSLQNPYFLLLGGGARPPNVPTEKKNHVYARASEASERLRYICIFRSQNASAYIYNQYSGMALYK